MLTDAPDCGDGEDTEALDPRTVDNLVDGHNYTTDDLHAWLAGFQVKDKGIGGGRGGRCLAVVGGVWRGRWCLAWVGSDIST